jgi:RND family efflux transporter MFP subunit
MSADAAPVRKVMPAPPPGVLRKPKQTWGWRAAGEKWKTAARPLRMNKARILCCAALLAGVVAVALPVASWIRGVGTAETGLVCYTVKRGDLPITVIERGNLESQENVKIYCEVDDIRGDGIDGTPILWIIPNGATVKKGDLLIEFDEAPYREQLDAQILQTETARAEHMDAVLTYENQETENETTKAAAELAVDLANLELAMFKDEEKGTHKLAVEEIERTVDDLQNEILAAKANLQLKRNETHGIETLFKMGYAGKSELDRSRLEYLQAESQYAAKLNRLATTQATLLKKEDYEYKMQRLKLEGDLETAKRNLKQVQFTNEALMAKAEAEKIEEERSLKKEEERLARYQQSIQNCKVFAPQDGMVAYAIESGYRRREVAAGALAHERQHLLSLPNLSKMQVKTAVHESVLEGVKVGLPATVTIDAYPDQTYEGTVRSVAVLPDPGGWMSTDTKVYETVVTIDEEVTRIKPGMTAVTEIHIDRIHDVLTVPVQAVVQVKDQTWCYVEDQGSLEQRPVQPGRTNGTFVEIRSGLAAGDHVVLNPGVPSESSDEPASESEDEGSTETADDRTQDQNTSRRAHANRVQRLNSDHAAI